MNATRYRHLLDRLELTQRGLAPVLGCSDRLTREWATGKTEVPPGLAAWLELNARARKIDPSAPLTEPPEWRRKPVTLVRLDGEMLPLAEACKRAGLPSRQSVMFQMERYGLSLQRAFDKILRQRGVATGNPIEDRSHAALVAALIDA